MSRKTQEPTKLSLSSAMVPDRFSPPCANNLYPVLTGCESTFFKANTASVRQQLKVSIEFYDSTHKGLAFRFSPRPAPYCPILGERVRHQYNLCP